MSKAWESGSDSRWRRFRLGILERDKWECRLRLPGCTLAAEHVHHLVPLSKGGDKYDPLNCASACRWCNLRQGNATNPPQPEPRPLSSW